MADPLGMARRVRDRDGAALREAEDREALEPELVDHGLEVAHHRLEREVVDVVIGEAVAALVVAHQRAVVREADEPVPPHWALPVVVEVRDPVCCPNQGRPCADRRERKASAVVGGAELDVLPQLFRHLEPRPFHRVGGLLHRRDEAVPPPVDRLHDLLVLAGVANGLPELLDRASSAPTR